MIGTLTQLQRRTRLLECRDLGLLRRALGCEASVGSTRAFYEEIDPTGWQGWW